MSNLQKRIITAVVLLALFIPALYVSTPWPFLLLTLLLIGAAAWEWSRLIGWTGWRAWASGALCVAVDVIAVITLLLPGWTRFMAASDTGLDLPMWLRIVVAYGIVAMVVVVCLLWLIGVPWLLWRGVARWPVLPRWLRWCIGMAMLTVAWFALAQAYIEESVNFLLSALALVWTADIGGYAFGRAFGGKLTGGRKLAPAISPGKTWEGALGGFICVLLVGAVWAWIELRGTLTFLTWPWLRSIYAFWWLGGPIGFLVGAAFFTAMSIVGDLFESMVKRAAGAKDSSQLLPGHGGVLDRIDALLPTLPLALFVTTLPVLAVMLLGKMQ